MKDQLHVDLETMGIERTSRILSIGAVYENTEFYVEVDQSHYVGDKFTQNQSTVEWWARQGGFTPSCPPVSPFQAIDTFGLWVAQVADLAKMTVWANSPSFDCEILSHHFEFHNLARPWEFWQERDVRTIKMLARDLRLGVKEPQNPHHALADAKNQQQLVHSVYQTLLTTGRVYRELLESGQITNGRYIGESKAREVSDRHLEDTAQGNDPDGVVGCESVAENNGEQRDAERGVLQQDNDLARQGLGSNVLQLSGADDNQ